MHRPGAGPAHLDLKALLITPLCKQGHKHCTKEGKGLKAQHLERSWTPGQWEEPEVEPGEHEHGGKGRGVQVPGPQPGLTTASSLSEVERPSPRADISPPVMSLQEPALAWPRWPWTSHSLGTKPTEPQCPCPCPQDGAGMPRTGVTPHLIQGSVPTHRLSSEPHSRGARDGAEGGPTFRDTIFTVAFINDDSWSCETRSMRQRWSHVLIFQRGKLKPRTGQERELHEGTPSASLHTVGC